MQPDRPSSFTTPARDAWFLVTGPGRTRFFATTGRAFVEQVQTVLANARYGARKAYRVDGPLGGGYLTGASNTDFGQVIVDGRWGPTTNAALWRYIAEHSGANVGRFPAAGDFDARTLRYLDAIEEVARTRRISEKAVEAAIWVWLQGTLPWTESESIGFVGTPPIYDVAPPRPTDPRIARGGPGEMVAWLDGEEEPGQGAGDSSGGSGSGTPTRRPGTPPSSFPWVPVGVTVAVLGAVGLMAARKAGRI